MRAIFISYRREDAEGQAGRLFGDLANHFGDDTVFMDVTAIEPGRDFRRVIDEQVASCSVLLAVIGKNWIDAKDEAGLRRLEDPMDFVRLETASALKRDIPVVPVLIQGARIPRAEQLPGDLAELAYRNGVELTHARWDSDVQVLIKALSPYVASLQKKGGRTQDPAAAALRTTRRVDGAAPPPIVQAVKKSLHTIIAISATAIIITFVGYLAYRNAAEEAQFTRVSEHERIAAEKAKDAESGRLAQESAREKVEADRVAVAKANAGEKRIARDRANKQAESDRIAKVKEKLEEDRLAFERTKVQAEADRIALVKGNEMRARWMVYDFPAPNGGLLVYRIMTDGNPACASYDGSNCLWGVSYNQIDFSRVRPLVCGSDHRAKWDVTGYEDPKHWCGLARRVRANVPLVVPRDIE